MVYKSTVIAETEQPFSSVATTLYVLQINHLSSPLIHVYVNPSDNGMSLASINACTTRNCYSNRTKTFLNVTRICPSVTESTTNSNESASVISASIETEHPFSSVTTTVCTCTKSATSSVVAPFDH